jgi:hypothetical protein
MAMKDRAMFGRITAAREDFDARTVPPTLTTETTVKCEGLLPSGPCTNVAILPREDYDVLKAMLAKACEELSRIGYQETDELDACPPENLTAKQWMARLEEETGKG